MTVPHDRLARSAHRLRWVAIAGIALAVAAAAISAWAIFAGGGDGGPLVLRVDMGGLAPVAAAIVLAVVAFLVVLALLQLIALLRAVEQGRPFGTGGRLRRFACYLFLSVLAAVLLPPLVQLGTALSGTPQRVHLSLSNQDALMLLLTGLLFFVARLLEAAQCLAEDHEQIV